MATDFTVLDDMLYRTGCTYRVKNNDYARYVQVGNVKFYFDKVSGSLLRVALVDLTGAEHSSLGDL